MQPAVKNHLRIPYDSLTLCAVIAELQSRVVGSRIQRFSQPHAHLMQFEVYGAGKPLLLNVGIDAVHTRMHLSQHRLKNSAEPSSFCNAVRRSIIGGIITDVEQIGFDRLAEVKIQAGTDENAICYRLIVELMGKHSNVVLVDSSGRIVDSAIRVSRRINRVRETLPGLHYTPIPALIPGSIPSADRIAHEIDNAGHSPSPEVVTAAIRQFAPFVSPFLAAQLCLRKFGNRSVDKLSLEIHEQLQQLFVSHEFDPISLPNSVGAAAYPIHLLFQDGSEISCNPETSINAALDIGYSRSISEHETSVALGQLSAAITNELRKVEKVKVALERSISEGDRSVRYEQMAELLLANLWRVNKGDEVCNVIDYYSEDQMTIDVPLKPDQSPMENIEHYFTLAKRARESRGNALSRLSAVQSHFDKLLAGGRDLTARSESTDVTASDIKAFHRLLLDEDVLTEATTQTPGKVNEFSGFRIKRVTDANGFEILIGESATANDYLTTRLAKSNDLWLHVRSATSAHVVIRTHGRPQDVPRATIEEAAKLCARHSAQKHSSLVAVDCTEKRYVRKPRKAPPGSVVIERSTVFEVTP